MKKEKAAFDFLSSRLLLWDKVRVSIKELYDGASRSQSKQNLSPNGGGIGEGPVPQSEISRNMINLRYSQIRMIQERDKSEFDTSVAYESDEEIEDQPDGTTVDLKDKDDQWKQIYLKRSFYDMAEYLRTAADGTNMQDYLMNSEGRVAPPFTATVEYGYCPLENIPHP